jgi:hypothetical protein
MIRPMIGLAKRLPGVRGAVPAGLVDAGAASLAHFLVGLTAVNLLDPSDLGVYAVYFAAFMVATIVSQALVFTPAEVIAVSHPVEHRLSQVLRGLKLGIGPLLVGASVVVVAALATRGQTSMEVTVGLAVTSGAAILVSPAQDHIRRLLHIAARSWSAAGVSIVQVVAVTLALGAMISLDVPAAWIPFGALAIANLVSFGFGVAFALSGRTKDVVKELSFRELAESGRWLLVMAVIPFGALFLGSIIIVELAGPEVMGFAEAARVAAQPIVVVATGLSAVLGPRGVEAAIHKDYPMARSAHHLYLGLILGTGVLYLLIAGHDWVGNPMAYLVPVAYVVQGLAAVTIIANIITAATVQFTNELVGGRKEVELTRMSLIASPFLLVGAATASVTGAFARSLGIILEGSVRYGLYSAARGRIYREVDEPTEVKPAL